MLKKMKSRSYREEVNRLKRKVKVVKNEVSVRLKNKASRITTECERRK